MLKVKYDLSIITATHQRHVCLDQLFDYIDNQNKANLKMEHIVVSDGYDSVVENKCSYRKNTKYGFCEYHGFWGAKAKDVGIELSRGEYVCFFDDDNIYYNHALLSLYASAYNHDIGVVQCIHQTIHGFTRIIPENLDQGFKYKYVDTMCVCVERALSLKQKWADHNQQKGTDYQWLQKLCALGDLRINFLPIVIGVHT